jgi:hypothetical protein
MDVLLKSLAFNIKSNNVPYGYAVYTSILGKINNLKLDISRTTQTNLLKILSIISKYIVFKFVQLLSSS